MRYFGMRKPQSRWCWGTTQFRFLLFQGAGVPQSYTKAIFGLKAANQGDKEAQTILGFCYYVGTGVDKSQKRAIYWFGEGV